MSFSATISTMAARSVPVLLALCMIGCDFPGGNGEDVRENGSGAEATPPADTAETAEPGDAADIADTAEPSDSARTILFVGTSLTAGYGVRPEQAYPRLIEERLRREGFPHRVVNAGRSGETSAGALGRIDRLLRQPFEVLVLETGANDMLRGIDPATTRENIDEILRRVRERRPDASIVLVGMRAAPNLGEAYVREFDRIYPELAEAHDTALVPFLLEGVAGERRLNLPDGIHPNERGHERVAETVWEVLEGELRATNARNATNETNGVLALASGHPSPFVAFLAFVSFVAFVAFVARFQ